MNELAWFLAASPTLTDTTPGDGTSSFPWLEPLKTYGFPVLTLIVGVMLGIWKDWAKIKADRSVNGKELARQATLELLGISHELHVLSGRIGAELRTEQAGGPAAAKALERRKTIQEELFAILAKARIHKLAIDTVAPDLRGPANALISAANNPNLGSHTSDGAAAAKKYADAENELLKAMRKFTGVREHKPKRK